MGDVFVRRTTGVLLFIVVTLCVICVALTVLLLSSRQQESSNEELRLVDDDHHVPHQFQDALEGKAEIMPTTTAISTTTSTTALTPTTVTTSPESPEDELKDWERNIRIPRTTIPYHYDLLLHPNLETETFTGSVSILIGVTSSMKYLLTHVKLMNITSTKLFDSSGLEYDLENAFEYEPNQFWVVLPTQVLTPGNYTLSIDFDGSLSGHIVGFYMSEYTTKSGEKRSIATSKFQPTDARRAFPCFDEPTFKSTFKTTLIRPTDGYIALSNMPVEKEMAASPSLGFTRVEFEKSVPMVTYLACFIVCDFEYVEAKTAQNKPFRVYSTSDQIERAQYALKIGVHILNYFERYFEVDYPLPKQDMIAIPDFVSGAMEHWGLITYRETNLLYDEINSSSSNKQRVATVVSHELAHMWFGNLVTLKWWDDLWLNEGFASYMEYKGLADYEKDWEMEDQFLTDDLHSVFELDQILASHPIVQPVNHPDEITEIFDAISYSKGASVLRMLENFMGAENFRIGVSNFLKRFIYGSAVTQDLWNELQELSKGMNITRIMDTWTRQMGFPVLDVRASPIDKRKLEVSQQRFLVDPEAKSDNDSIFHYKWDVPVTFKTNSQGRKQVWFKIEDDKIMVDRPLNANWIKFNVDQYGFYRVNYDEDLWMELINVLKTDQEVLSPSDRANLIDDSFNLAAAKMLPYDVAFEVISYLPKESHYVPWSSASSHLTDIGDLLRSSKAYKAFRTYVVSLVSPQVERLGWEDTGSHTERRNRGNILNLACSNGHQGCLENAVSKFQEWIYSENASIPANLRSIAYIYGIKGTGEQEWDILFERYLVELNAQEKAKMLRGLTSTKDSWICNRLLDLSQNTSIIRKQDFFTMLTYFAYNPSTLSTVWSFVRAKWEWMVQEFGLNNRYLGRTVRSIAYQFVSPIELKELESFFEEYPEAGSGKRSRQQGLEKANQNIKWVKNYAESLYQWLSNNTL